jgi:hypothetical protein
VRDSPRPAWTWGGPSCPGESRIRLDQFTAPKWKPHFAIIGGALRESSLLLGIIAVIPLAFITTWLLDQTGTTQLIGAILQFVSGLELDARGAPQLLPAACQDGGQVLFHGWPVVLVILGWLLFAAIAIGLLLVGCAVLLGFAGSIIGAPIGVLALPWTREPLIFAGTAFAVGVGATVLGGIGLRVIIMLGSSCG